MHIRQTSNQLTSDKSLVVWVALANLTQRGGSALAIEDGSDHFDGIVFGELTPATWMAGSDMFARTQKDQSNIPPETIEGTTFVQLAIVYRGKQISVYRSGQLVSQHAIAAQPQEFGPRSIVSIGKRHRSQGGDARFAGSIDDARIYDHALSAEQLTALQPNVAEGVIPWAWWTFDDEQAQERTGRFLITQLSDGASDLRIFGDGIISACFWPTTCRMSKPTRTSRARTSSNLATSTCYSASVAI